MDEILSHLKDDGIRDGPTFILRFLIYRGSQITYELSCFRGLDIYDPGGAEEIIIDGNARW